MRVLLGKEEGWAGDYKGFCGGEVRKLDLTGLIEKMESEMLLEFNYLI